MKKFLREIVYEKAFLEEKLIELKQFTKTDKFESLPEEETDLLYRQIDSMQNYFNILEKRVARF